MTNRRDFIQWSAAAALAGVFGERVPTRAPMRILILGGTGFIGPHIVHAALARGHKVSILNRGQRAPTEHAADFAQVEAILGDRSLPTAYENLKGRSWDAVIDTAQQVPWTRAAVHALRDWATRYMYVSSTGVFSPYRTADIPEDGPIRMTDEPPRDPPSYGVMKA